MSAHVILSNEYGDTMSGYRIHIASDQPNVIQVNGTQLYETVWIARGWTITNDERL